MIEKIVITKNHVCGFNFEYKFWIDPFKESCYCATSVPVYFLPILAHLVVLVSSFRLNHFFSQISIWKSTFFMSSCPNECLAADRLKNDSDAAQRKKQRLHHRPNVVYISYSFRLITFIINGLSVCERLGFLQNLLHRSLLWLRLNWIKRAALL